MRTTRDKVVFLMSATLSAFATIALASAATSPARIEPIAPHAARFVWPDTFCEPGYCTHVIETMPGGPPSVLY